MGTGCSTPSSRRVSHFHRKFSTHSSRYEWSLSEMRPISSHGFNGLPSGSAGAFATGIAGGGGGGGNLLSNGLTLIEAHLLRKTWPSNSIEQAYELGLDIFDEVFRLEPEMRRYFPCLSTESAKDLPLKSVSEIRSQIIRFVSMLTLCVRYCDQPQHLDDHLSELGRRHRQYVAGAQINHFRVFEKAVSMVMRRRAELHGVEEQDDADSGYCGGSGGLGGSSSSTGGGVTWHPSSPMDKSYATTAKFRNPKEQVRATIAWTTLAAYVTKQMMKGYYAVEQHEKTSVKSPATAAPAGV